MFRNSLMILSGQLGAGHHQAARALALANQNTSVFYEVEIFDLMKILHPRWHVLEKQLFEHSVKSFPVLYGYLYQKTRHTFVEQKLLQRMGMLFGYRLLELIKLRTPDAIVSTFPIASLAISALKASGRLDIPFTTVITDHTDHNFWIQPHTDLYCVGSEYTKECLLRKDIPPSRITVTGIPIDPGFQSSANTAIFNKNLDLLPHQPTILLMGGGCGIMDDSMTQLLQKAKQLDAFQWVVVCGNNHKLYNHLQHEYTMLPHVHILGYVDPIYEIMAISDLLITKPGGLTTSEALSLELPMILTNPLPGQEQDNAKFLTESGAALLVRHAEELIETVEIILQNPDTIKKMKQQALKIKKPAASINTLMELNRLITSPADDSIAIAAIKTYAV